MSIALQIKDVREEVRDAIAARAAARGQSMQAYLRDILCLLPRWPSHRDLELAPLNWAKTAAVPETRALLDANPYRRATLSQG